MHKERTMTVEDFSEETPSMVYSGFDRDFGTSGLKHVILYTVDGELEVLALQDPKQLDGVMRYLQSCDGKVNLVGSFTRTGL